MGVIPSSSLLFALRTADRSPKRNYLDATLRSMLAAGIPPSQIVIVPTAPEWAWVSPWVFDTFDVEPVKVRRHANANGIALVDCLDGSSADWLILCEDDLDWCGDAAGSCARWLSTYATPERVMYRFFTFGSMRPIDKHAAETPLVEQWGSQAVALRAEDARRFASWARAHPTDWRPKYAPFQDRPNDGFDKLLGYWALQDRPLVKTGLVSRPFFVRHLGVESSLHRVGLTRDNLFGRSGYRPMVREGV